MQDSIAGLRAGRTGHDRGCECDTCLAIGADEVRDELGCEQEPGSHQWLADFYLAVIEPGRLDLWDVPEWVRELAIIGDNQRAEAKEKRRKRRRRKQKRGTY